MLVSRGQLITILKENVCEIKFNRRVPVQGKSLTRRMLCTNSFTLLNSENGKLTLNYRPTSRLPNYNPAIKDLIITWDIFMQNYRQVNCSQPVDLVRTIPANEEFWKYFTENLQTLTAEQKINFQNT